MDFRLKSFFHILGLMLFVEAAAMLPSLCYAVYLEEPVTSRAFGISAAVTGIVGLLMNRLIPRSARRMRLRDGYFTMIFVWIICTAAAMFPYYLSGQVNTIIDAFFEASASLTTTGASVVQDRVFTDPLILWKAVCSWLGGVTFIAYMISIMPSFGMQTTMLASIETPGAKMASATVKTSDQVKVLYLAYAVLTAAEFILLWVGSDMNIFEAIVNTLGSVSTAGIFLHPGGIAYYNSFYVEVVVVIFTILASINFMLYIKAVQGNFRSIISNVELRVFIGLIVFSTLIIAAALYIDGIYDSVGESLRYALLQTTAFSSTSGFTITDYTQWPSLCQMILFLLLFIGGCTASTAGGIKVIRFSIMCELIRRGFYRRIHPRATRAVKLGGTAISAPLVSSVTAFITLFLGVFLVTAAVLSLQGLDFSTTLSASVSLLSTTGSSFGIIGNTGDYSVFCQPIRLFCSLIMIFGRVELYAALLVFVPEFWNPNRSRTVK